MNTTNRAFPHTVAVATVRPRAISGSRVMETKDPAPPAGSFPLCPMSHPAIALIRLNGRLARGYFTSMTNGGRIVTLPADREADIQQAQIFHALLDQRRAELCDLLDEQAINLGRYERSHETAVVRRKRRRIKEIGAEVRDIDRMIHGLRGRLLDIEQKRRSV